MSQIKDVWSENEDLKTLMDDAIVIYIFNNFNS